MFEKCIYFSLNATVRELNRIWDHEFKAVGLTAPQGYMVIAILRNPDLCQKEIAEQMHLDRSTVTRLLEGLEKKGLIKREGGSSDFRTVHVSATAKAKKLAPKFHSISQRLMKKMQDFTKREDIEQLVNHSNQFLERLQT